MPQLTHTPGPADRPRTKRTFGAYLYWLGRRAHHAKQHRTPTPVLNRTREPIARFINHTFPWSVRDYPGKWAMLGHILGIKPTTAQRYMHPGIAAPASHIRRCIAWLEARRAADAAMISTLQTYLPPGQK